MSAVADSVDIEVAQITLTLDRTADTLHDAGSLAGSFAVTFERTPPSVRQAAFTIRDLRPHLEQIDLDTDRGALVGNARSLTEAGDQTAILADRVRAGFIQQGVGDIRAVLSIAMVVLAGWAAVPATGALLLGLWLRRSLAPRVPDRERSRRLDPRPSSDHGPAM